MISSVLIAEDEVLLRRMMVLEFEENHVPVRAVSDGEQVLTMIEREPPQLLLLDLLMPKMDGYAVLRHLQENGCDFPIIVLSNLSDPSVEDRCRKLGANGFFVKSDLDAGDLWTMAEPFLIEK